MRWNEKIVERMKMLGMRHVSDLARACKPEIHERRAYRIYNGDEPTISELYVLCNALKLKLRHFEEDAELPPARVEVDVPAGMSPEDLLAAARLLAEQRTQQAHHGS